MAEPEEEGGEERGLIMMLLKECSAQDGCRWRDSCRDAYPWGEIMVNHRFSWLGLECLMEDLGECPVESEGLERDLV
jgi:hypothetical protein